MLTTITVNSLDDGPLNPVADGNLTLREAVQAANSDSAYGDAPAGSGVDVIDFSVSGTILLQSGEIEATETLIITGPGAEQLTIDAQQDSRIFNITAVSGDTSISGITFINGETTGNNGAPTMTNDSTFSGGAIRSLSIGELTLDSTIFADNVTLGGNARAGAVFAFGRVTITSSSFTNNSTARDNGDGGAVFSSFGLDVSDSVFMGNRTMGKGADGGALHGNQGTVTVTNSILSGNTSGDDGGAIWSGGNITINSSTISNNSTKLTNTLAGGVGSNNSVTVNHSTISNNHSMGFFSNGRTVGGGGVHGRDVFITHSTISGNSTGSDGGGISSERDLTLRYSTVTDNSALGNGGGIEVGVRTAAFEHSIVAGNSAWGVGPDLVRPGIFGFSLNDNLIGDKSGTLLTEAQMPDAKGNLIGSASGMGIIIPLLGKLADNGGDKLTHALLVGSPALNAGDPGFTAPPDFDQRETPFDRVVFGQIDIGALEQNISADFDLDADVDGADFLASQPGFGLISGAEHSEGDADGNEAVDGQDLAIWDGAFGFAPPPVADFNLNGLVNGADFLDWQLGFGISNFAQLAEGDADHDGDVDDLDFEEWETKYGLGTVLSQPAPLTSQIAFTSNHIGHSTELSQQPLKSSQVSEDMPGTFSLSLPDPFSRPLASTTAVQFHKNGEIAARQQLFVNQDGVPGTQTPLSADVTAYRRSTDRSSGSIAEETTDLAFSQLGDERLLLFTS